MPSSKVSQRVLAIDPTARGFAFVVLEGPQRLVKWGLKQAREQTRDRQRRAFARLLKEAAPAALIVEDSTGGTRSWCKKDLIADFIDVARAENITLAVIRHQQVKNVFAAEGAKDRDAMAKLLAGQFPELSHRLPPKRKLWTAEDRRIRMFNALALALTYYAPKKKDDQ